MTRVIISFALVFSFTLAQTTDTNVAALQTRIAELEAQLAQRTTLIRQQTIELDLLKSDLRALTAYEQESTETILSLRMSNSRYLKRAAELAVENTNLKQELRALNSSIALHSQSTAELKTLGQENEVLRQSNADLKAQLEGLSSHLSQAESNEMRVTELQTRNKRLIEIAARLSTEKLGLEQQLNAETLVEADEADSRITELQARNRRLVLIASRLSNEADKLKTQLSDKSDSSAALELRFGELEAELAREQEDSKQQLAAYEVLEGKYDNALVEAEEAKQFALAASSNNELEILNTQIAFLTAENEQLKSQLLAYQANASTPIAASSITYRVQSGDSLTSIATDFYGDGGEWVAIAEANDIPLDDANAISPGMVLVIPQQ